MQSGEAVRGKRTEKGGWTRPGTDTARAAVSLCSSFLPLLMDGVGLQRQRTGHETTGGGQNKETSSSRAGEAWRQPHTLPSKSIVPFIPLAWAYLPLSGWAFRSTTQTHSPPALVVPHPHVRTALSLRAEVRRRPADRLPAEFHARRR